MGLIVGILTGFFISLQNTCARKLSAFDTFALNGSRFAASAVILAVAVSIFSSWHIPPLAFFVILFITLPIDILISFCYIKAFQLSPQSLVGPLFSLTAIFLLPLDFFVFGYVPSILGLIGVMVGLLGSFFLGWDIHRPGELITSFRVIFREKGTYYMLVATVASAAGVILAKFSFSYAPPMVSGFYMLAALTLFYLPSFLRHLKASGKEWKNLSVLGVVHGFSNIFHYFGLSLMPAAYFISLKRSAILFDVFFGKFIQHETHFGGRLLGASLMLIGIILIAVA